MKQAARTHLVEARKRRQWTQQEVADLLGTTQHNVSRWERDQTRPGVYFRTKLCALFGTNAQELGLLTNEADERLSLPLSPAAPAHLPTTPASASQERVSLWLVPYPRNPFFTGRDELLEQVEQRLTPTTLNTPAIPCALC